MARPRTQGFVVLAFDPPSQGERLMYLNTTTGMSNIGWGVAEHQYFGRQLFLNGVAAASIWMWDMMRCVSCTCSCASESCSQPCADGLSPVVQVHGHFSQHNGR